MQTSDLAGLMQGGVQSIRTIESGALEILCQSLNLEKRGLTNE